MQEQRNELDQSNVLDHIHAMAMEHSIVTPYSSMIVLVTNRQEQMLDKLEASEDRFQREYEDVGETIPENNLMVTRRTGAGRVALAGAGCANAGLVSLQQTWLELFAGQIIKSLPS